MACGNALAIDPWLKEPSILRFPFIVRYRAAQIVGVPTSHVKTASSDASWSITRATCWGWMGFLPESRREIRVTEVLGAEELERDVSAKPGVGGAIDGRHPALTEQFDQPVALIQDLTNLRQAAAPRSANVFR